MEFYVRVLDPVRRLLFSRLPLPMVRSLAHLPASVLFIGLRLGLGRIEYFRLLRRFPYRHVHHIVFDQMIPRIAHYWRRDEVEALMQSTGFETPEIVSVNDVSWCSYGRRAGGARLLRLRVRVMPQLEHEQRPELLAV